MEEKGLGCFLFSFRLPVLVTQNQCCETRRVATVWRTTSNGTYLPEWPATARFLASTSCRFSLDAETTLSEWWERTNNNSPPWNIRLLPSEYKTCNLKLLTMFPHHYSPLTKWDDHPSTDSQSKLVESLATTSLVPPHCILEGPDSGLGGHAHATTGGLGLHGGFSKSCFYSYTIHNG